MEVYEAILKRRSIRRFRQDPISREVLEKIVNAGRLAPSAANLQPCEYIVVDRADLLRKVFENLKWAGYIRPKGNPPRGEEATAYIVVLVNTSISKEGYGKDCGAAIENMILTALAEGIGSCWIGSIERENIRKILKIPGHLEIDSILALGYPNEEPLAEEMKDSIRYWKDSAGRLHIPKRRLASILHFNGY